MTVEMILIIRRLQYKLLNYDAVPSGIESEILSLKFTSATSFPPGLATLLGIPTPMLGKRVLRELYELIEGLEYLPA